MKKAIVELRQNPYYTDFLFYPYGHTLIFHCLSPFNELLARSDNKEYGDFLKSTPGIASILLNREVFFNRRWPYELVSNTVKNTFKHHKIKYVIVPAPSDDYPENYIVEVYGFKKVYEDNEIRAYLVYDEK